MEVKDYIQGLKKQYSINLTSVYETKKKYLSLYRAYMVQLYDKGYISDPTCYSEKEIRRNINEYDIKGMTQSSGRVVLTSEQAGFALAKKGIVREGIEFLRILKKVLYYRECSLNLDKFYDTCDFSKAAGKKLSLGILYSGSKIYTRKPYEISEPVLECFFYNRTIGKKIVKVSLNSDIYERALDILGLKGDTRDGLFIKGMSRKDEIKYCRLFFDGLVTIDGLEKDRLEKWLKGHIWNQNIEEKYRYLKTGLYEYITTQEVDLMLSYQKKLLNNCISSLGDMCVLFLTTTTAFCLKPVEEVDFPVSAFVIFAEDNDRVTAMDRNTLEGYTGEVYALDSFTPESGNYYVGCPIELFTEDGVTKKLFVDLEQTSFYSNGRVNSWFACDPDRRLDFDESYYTEGVFPKGSLEDIVFKVVADADRGIMIGKVPICKTNTAKGEFEKVKDRVSKEVFADNIFQNRKSGLLLLQEGQVTMARELLLPQFSINQVEALNTLLKEGYSFSEVWKVANPVFNAETMLKLMRGEGNELKG